MRGPFSNPASSESGINLLVAGLGPKDAKEYCEIEMLNEKLENARVAAGAAVNALKGNQNSRYPDKIFESFRSSLNLDNISQGFVSITGLKYCYNFYFWLQVLRWTL